MTLSVGGSAVVVLVLPWNFSSWEYGDFSSWEYGDSSVHFQSSFSLSITIMEMKRKNANGLWKGYTKKRDMRKSHLRQSGLMDGMNSEEVAFPFEITVMLCNGGVTERIHTKKKRNTDKQFDSFILPSEPNQGQTFLFFLGVISKRSVQGSGLYVVVFERGTQWSIEEQLAVHTLFSFFFFLFYFG